MKTTTVGRYLVERLEQCGLRHVFGIPGDYVLGFCDLIVASRQLQFVGACTEAGAAFAADAYARVKGLGAICVTYCVGGLNTLNAVAGAYAEKSPIVVMSGAPGLGERARSPLLHHRVKDFNTQRLIFEKVTVAAEALEDPATAPTQIEETLRACLRQKRPVYLELPRDVVDQPCAGPGPLVADRPARDPAALAEAIEEATAMLRRARRPAVLAGVEIHRFGLQESLLELVRRSGFPVAATLLGKSVISERHPNYVGVYEGAMGRGDVRRLIEGSDCLLILGAFMTDINLGVFTARLAVARTINATSESIQIRHHQYNHVPLKEFIDGLAGRAGRFRRPRRRPRPASTARFRPQKGRRLTIRRFFARMDEFLRDDTIVIADIGDSLFGAADLTIHRRTEFLSPAYYTSMGFAVPAAAGAQLARPGLRPIVFVGDGAFQMTGQELSMSLRHGLNPIVFVLNNEGYTTERFIHEGPYNDILNWRYHRFIETLGGGWGCEVRTEGELEEALATAEGHGREPSLINVRLDRWDHSLALERLGRRLARQGGLKPGRG